MASISILTTFGQLQFWLVSLTVSQLTTDDSCTLNCKVDPTNLQLQDQLNLMKDLNRGQAKTISDLQMTVAALSQQLDTLASCSMPQSTNIPAGVTVSIPSSSPTSSSSPVYPTVGSCASSNFGKHFYVAFMQTSSSPTLKIFVAPATSGSTPSVTIQVQGSSTTAVVPATGYSFTVANSVLLSGTTTASGVGITISASDYVTVVAFSEQKNISVTATLILPSDALSQTYYVATYYYYPTQFFSQAAAGDLAQIVILATLNGTTVNVTFSAFFIGTVAYAGRTYTNRTTLVLTMNALQVVQIQSTNDLIGTRITSTAKIAVFAGNINAPNGFFDQGTSKNAPNFHQQGTNSKVQQLQAAYTSANPLSTTSKYTYRTQQIHYNDSYELLIVATNDNTNFTIYNTIFGSPTQFGIPSTGEWWLNIILGSGTVKIDSNYPVVVMQMSEIMLTIQSQANCMRAYSFVIPFDTAALYTNYIFIIANASDTSGLILDGDLLDSGASWYPSYVGDSYMLCNIAVTSGVHTLANPNAVSPFFVSVYGNTTFNYSFAYPAGLCFDGLSIL